MYGILRAFQENKVHNLRRPRRGPRCGTLRKLVDAATKSKMRGGGVPPPIDYYMKPDVTITHELTHATCGYATLDVDDAYHWYEIYTFGQKPGRPNANKPTNNAESFAYWSLVSNIITPGGVKTGPSQR